MSMRKLLKYLHVCGTACFTAAVVFSIIAALRQAGVKWWLIFSLSGNAAAILFLLISAYLYALFGNKKKHPGSSIEHPITCTRQYSILYSAIPFLGMFTGLLCTINTDSSRQIPLAAALGIIGATFLFWIIVDPLIGCGEMLLPASRKMRLERCEIARMIREQKRLENDRLLSDIVNEERIRNQQWQEVLGAEAQKLAQIAIEAIDENSFSAKCNAVEIGLHAWRRGGFECMQKLCDMTSGICGRGKITDEYISIWWDGIGQWRHKLAI
jgi:hypothetical protein